MPQDYKNEIFEEKMTELVENLECISLKNVFSGSKFGRYIDIVSWKDDTLLVLKHFSRTSGLILSFGK